MMMPMKMQRDTSWVRIAADSAIPGIADACAGMGELVMFDSMNHDAVRNAVNTADVLLCRSTIRVDDDLLAGTPVRFVATATSGVDHIDTAACARRGIVIASAAGSNARSVAEYVCTTSLLVSDPLGLRMQELTVGVIGAGHVGSRVAAMLQALGARIILNDPPREAAGAPGPWVSLDEALRCDVVTVHVPLIRTGPWPTLSLIDDRALRRMRDGAVLINTARGLVVDESALQAHRHRLGAIVLDVFAGEPVLSLETVAAARIATPHVAGHAHDGKLRGTWMVVSALADVLGMDALWTPASALPPSAPLPLPDRSCHRDEWLARACLAACPVHQDDAAVRSWMTFDEQQRREAFQRYRAAYPIRREFTGWSIPASALPASISPALLSTLGFHVIA